MKHHLSSLFSRYSFARQFLLALGLRFNNILCLSHEFRRQTITSIYTCRITTATTTADSNSTQRIQQTNHSQLII
ncbi:hypothetical protein FN846DRAFT_943311 [Sphaerosporella brunnea]|uniref:Uncharacterized protein n=1 Tax=Sphaerosporella brunnea TaxID=1250544 RepID=A0A5J5F0V2_9PEZI|nr:hypothetical protein FN846DRAFT_943311 [Sphaerosporella brunnea]